jgi:hypothetical protein
LNFKTLYLSLWNQVASIIVLDKIKDLFEQANHDSANTSGYLIRVKLGIKK